MVCSLAFREKENGDLSSGINGAHGQYGAQERRPVRAPYLWRFRHMRVGFQDQWCCRR